MENEELSYPTEEVDNPTEEKERFHEAVAASREQLEKIKEKVNQEMGADKAEIFAAHLKVVEDPELISAVEDKIDKEKVNAETAVDEVVDRFAAMFANMDNEYMQERAADVKDVGDRILKNLLGLETVSLLNLDEEIILAAQDLAPSDTAQLDKDKVLGFVTQVGGRTSHTAIMARSLEIPAVVGVNDLLTEIEQEGTVIMDGLAGQVVIDPTSEELAEYCQKKKEYEERKAKLAELKELPAKTEDGHQVEVVANIGTPDDVVGALDNGAEGVGLYRSEFLYMDRNSLPTEEEQFKAYKEVAEKLDGPIVIRTLDIGGDKELPYLDLPDELNPFLGYRAIRLCLDRPDIFKTQLRAILRASVFGEIKIMYPMISSIEELRAANQVLEEVKAELREEKIDFNEDLEVGMMIEVPAAAMTADLLAKEVDFFSIGTNDLVQYTTATDRMNENIADLYEPFHPAVLRLIKRTVKAAHEEDIWAGMCGELAGDKRMVPYLLGIGLDEFSMSAVSIPEVKNIIRQLTVDKAAKIADKALQMTTAEEIKEFLKQTIDDKTLN
jgi:phosphotransferase system enzyme I (PtsI)